MVHTAAAPYPLLNHNRFPHRPQTQFPYGFQTSPKQASDLPGGGAVRGDAEGPVSWRRSVWCCGRRPRGCFPHGLTALAGQAGRAGGRGGAAPPGGGHVGGGAARGGAGWGLQGGPAQPGLAFLQGRRDRKEWDIPARGWGPAASDPFASDLTVSSLPDSLARSWSAPYATPGPTLPPTREPCSRLLILSPLMAQPSSFRGEFPVSNSVPRI